MAGFRGKVDGNEQKLVFQVAKKIILCFKNTPRLFCFSLVDFCSFGKHKQNVKRQLFIFNGSFGGW